MTLMKQLFTDVNLFINILLTHRVFLQEKNAIRMIVLNPAIAANNPVPQPRSIVTAFFRER